MYHKQGILYDIFLNIEYSISFHNNNILVKSSSAIPMNKATLTLAAVLAAILIGTFATVVSPAFASGSSTTTVQVNKQTQSLSGLGVTIGVQNACNSIKILSTSTSLQC